MNDNIWIKIPGFSKYEINRESRQVRSRCKGKLRILKILNGSYKLRSDDGSLYRAKDIRFLYSATKNIDPRDIPRVYNVVKTKDNGFVLRSRQEMNEELREYLRKKKKFDVEKGYREAVCFCNIVMQAYRTRDFSMVINEIESRKAEVTEYIFRNGIAVRPERVQELWEEASSNVLDCIVEKRAYIVNLTGYLNRVVRSYAARKEKLEKTVVSLDAGFYSLQKYQ